MAIPKSFWYPFLALSLPLLFLFGGALLSPEHANPFSANGDFWQYHFPVREMASQNLREFGEFPKWDPRTFGGYPLFGELSTQFFYPFSLAYGLVGPAYAGAVFLALTVFHYALGGWGAYRWLRGHDLQPAACVGGAWFCMLLAKWHAHALVGQHPTLGLAWLPWVACSIERMRERGVREVLPLTFFLYMWVASLSANFLRDSIYFVFLFGFYSVYTSSYRLRQLFCLLAAALLSAGLSAFYLLPAFEFLAQCTRSTALPLEQVAYGSWPLWTLFTRLEVPLPISDIGWEATLFAGVTASLLGLLGLAAYRDSHTRFHLVLLFLWFLWLLGGNSPALGVMYKLLPAFKLFRYPERVALQLGWLGAPLVARGLQALSDSKFRVPAWCWGALALLVSPAALIAWFKGWKVGVLAVVLLVVALLVTHKPWPGRLPAMMTLLLLELLWLPASTVDLRSLRAILGDNALGAWLQGRPGRVWLTNNHMLAAPYCTMYDLEVNHGINGYVPWVTFRMAEQGVARQPLRYEFTHGIPNDLPVISDAYLSRGNYRYVASQQPIENPRLKLRATVPSYRTYDFVAPGGYFQMPPTHVYENTGCLPRARLVAAAEAATDWDKAFEQAHANDPAKKVVLETSEALSDFAWPASAQPVQWRVYGTNRRRATFEIPTGRSGAYLVVSEMYYPGWHAREHGQELAVYRADGSFCAVAVGPGRHEIEWEFEPRTFPRGRNISLLCLALAAGLAAWQAARPR